MIRGYANSGSAGKSYIGAIAEILAYYPRQIALKCADPIHGCARETKFMPTPSDVIGWCERAAKPLHEEAAREDRIAEQFRAREDWETAHIPDELKEKGRIWLDRTDPIAVELMAFNADSEKSRRAAGMAKIESATRLAFERECKAEGIDPARGISPSLLKTFGGI